MSKDFHCPHNNAVIIKNTCPINECPYHVSRVKELFEIDAKTNCTYYDSNLMQNVSSSRTQISALSRDTKRLLNPRMMRAMYEESLQKLKTLYSLMQRVPATSNCCKRCGYPTDGNNCISNELCDQRYQWVNYILSWYNVASLGIASQQFQRQLIWELLFQKELYAEPISLKLGYELLSKKHYDKIFSTE